MLAVPIDVALLDDDYSVVRTNLVAIVEEILVERPELRSLLAPDDGAHEEARTLRDPLQGGPASRYRLWHRAFDAEPCAASAWVRAIAEDF